MIRLYNSVDPEVLFKEAIRLEHIKHPDYSGIIYLTPSTLRARFATRIFHRIVNPGNKNNLCYIPPDITTPRELSRRLNSIYGSRTLLPAPLIPVLISLLTDKGMGLSVLISDFLRDLKQFHPQKDAEEIKDLTGKIIESYNLPDSLKGSIKESLETFTVYQQYLIRNNLIDEYDLQKLCSDYIRRWEDFKVAIIDGFHAPTKVEMLIIQSIIEKAENSLISIPILEGLNEVTNDYISFLKESFDLDDTNCFSKACRMDFKYHPYNDIESEVEGIARNIKSLFISGKIKDLTDVVVAFPKLDKYKEIIERVFHRYGIPFNMTHKKTLAKTRPFIDLFCLIQSVYEDYPKLKFSQFLSSRYFKKIPQIIKTWIPSLSLQSGIVSGEKAWLNFLSKGNERYNIKRIVENVSQTKEKTLFDESDRSLISGLAEIEKEIRDIFRKLEPLKEIKTSTAPKKRTLSTLSEISKRLKDILVELGFLDVTNDEDYKTFSDMKKQLWDCLDELSFLEKIKPVKIGLREFSEYLWHILNHIYVEKEVDGVTVTDIPGIASVAFLKNLYIGGLTDDDMPDRGGIDYILPESVKKGIGLPDLDKRLSLQKFLFENIIRSSANLHLSYPLSEGENKFLPSPFLYSGHPEKEMIPGIFSREEFLVMKAEKPLSKFLTEIKINSKALNLAGILNVTDIDSYRFCPRKFFIERVLKVLPPSIKEYDLEATTLGEIIHKVMERIIFETFENIDLLKEKAREIVNKIAEEKNIDPFWKGIIKDTFIEILPDIITKEMEIKGDGYSPFLIEKTVIGEPLKGIRLKGKIDRVDKSEEGLIIIDYKTGSDTLTCSKILEGKERLQLFLYAAILKTQGYRIDRVGIYSLKDITIKWCPSRRTCLRATHGQKSKGNAADIDEMITASLKYLEETVRELRSGTFPAKPMDDNYYICRQCHENPLCPYIQS